MALQLVRILRSGPLPFFFLLLTAAPNLLRAQKLWTVPADVPTIQQAILESEDGDTINVVPGRYIGQIDFAGKAITIQGTGPGVILSDDGTTPVVVFHKGEKRTSILSNVTVRGGASTANYDAGGIYISQASPTIQNSVITGNTGCGIGVHSGAPRIVNSIVSLNIQLSGQGCHNPTSLWANPIGGGIVLDGPTSDNLSTELSGNTIQDNADVYMASGVAGVDAGHVILLNNIITGNTSNGQGAGIGLYGDTSATIVQNLIYENTIDPTLLPQAYADIGAGINFDLLDGSQHLTRTVVVNNTIAENHVLNESGARKSGTQILALNRYDSVTFQNNLILSDNLQSAIDCNGNNLPNSSAPAFDHSDVYSNGASPYSGECANQTGTNGNLSADPLFDSAQTGVLAYTLRTSSPAIDTGNNNAYALPSLDIRGQDRLQNATGTSSPIIDIGVYEADGIPGTLPPPILPPTAPALSITLSPSAITLETQHHTAVQVMVMVTGSMNGPIQLGCGSLPAHASCAFAQSNLAIGGAGTYRTSLMIDTSDVLGYAMKRNSTGDLQFAFLPIAGLLLPFTNKRIRGILILVVLMSMFGLSACSGKLPYSTDPGSYIIAVQGVDQISKVTAQKNFTMTVTPAVAR